MSNPPEPTTSPYALPYMAILVPFNRAFLAEPRTYATKHLTLMLRFLAPGTLPSCEEFNEQIAALGELLNAVEPVSGEHRAQLATAGTYLVVAERAGQRLLPPKDWDE